MLAGGAESQPLQSIPTIIIARRSRIANLISPIQGGKRPDGRKAAGLDSGIGYCSS